MISGRFFTPYITILALWILAPTPSFAWWGFGGSGVKSGLNFDQGYDLNTVTTVRGRVVFTTAGESGGPVTIVMTHGSDTIRAITAPPWYWSAKGIAIKPQDEIQVQGAKAQGRDGVMYILSRMICNLTTGGSVELRSETGRPLWKGGGGYGRGGGGMQHRHGGGPPER